jgi:molybdate transport system substrate-binding protein
MKHSFKGFTSGLVIMLSSLSLIHSISAAEIKVFSGGPFEAAFKTLAPEFERETGHRVVIEYGTAPQLQKNLNESGLGDIYITSASIMKNADSKGMFVPQSLVLLGRGGAGVMVRQGAKTPTISTEQEFKDTLLKAEKIIYNKASTGLYMDKLVEKIGLKDQLESKTERFVNGDDIIHRVAIGKGDEVGVGAIAEIKLNISKGVQYVGPLPGTYQNYTDYLGAINQKSAHIDVARKWLDYIQTTRAKSLLVQTGLD